MTGYGVATLPCGDGTLTAEIRAVNHRYLEVRTNVSPELGPYAHEAEQALRGAVQRGRYDLCLRTTGAVPLALELDVEAARQTFTALRALAAELESGPVSLTDALAVLPQPLRAPGRDATVQTRVVEVVLAAVQGLDAMRDREGATLAAELAASLSALRRNRDEAASRSRGAVLDRQARLRERVQQLLAAAEVVAEPGRLETELALLADRSDVSEELVRIESHVAQLEALLVASGSIGRKLDFLLQELHREVNTLSAKVQDAVTTHVAVAMKSEIERMRQQAANVL